jgi:ABC-2 type transport system permease protein
MKLLRETGILFSYNLCISLRNPIWLILGIFQPVLYLLLFAPLLDSLNSAPGFPAGGGLLVFAPAALLMLCMFGPLFGGYGLIAQIRAGEIERLSVTPVSRLALLLGGILRDVAQVLVQGVLLFVVALLLGLNLENIGATAGMALLLLGLMGLLLASLSYAMALTLKDENAFSSVVQFALTPLLLLSGVLLPLTLAPDWLQAIAAFNPLAYSIDAMRALFAGRLGDEDVLRGFTIVIFLTVLALLWAGRSYRKVTA